MSDLSHAHSPIEHAVEKACESLLKKSTDFWEDRNKAMVELTRLICKFEGASAATLHEMFNINVYRALIEPVKQMILDLRSQQVRDTCIFLTHLSKITGGLMRFFLRDTFESIFIAAKVPNKVMSGYVDECIISMLQHTTFKSAIPVIIGEYRESKSKAAREKCLVYLNTILSYWDLVDKEGDQIDDIIRLGLVDASMKGRELAREAFISFRNIFPEKAERLKSSLSPSVLSRVVKAETKYDNKRRLSLQEREEALRQAALMPAPVQRTASDDDLDNIMVNGTGSARKHDGQDNAVNSIQALIQGNMGRPHPDRFSILQTQHSSSEYLDDNMEPVVMNNDFDNNVNGKAPMMEPLYMQQPLTPQEILPPHTSTWYESDQISPLTMDNGHGRNSLENGRHPHNISPQRQSMSPTKSPPAAVPKAKSHSMDGIQREVRDMSDIQIGTPVILKDKHPVHEGTVQFVGPTSFASGIWVGVQLEVPLGKNNGAVQGVQYFQCLPLHGIFVRPQQLLIVVPSILQSSKTPDVPAKVDHSITNDPSSRRSAPVKVDSPARTNAEKLRATLNIAHALKVKISKEMHMLNHQLSMVENFELQVQGTEGVNQEDCTHFVNSLTAVMYEEETLSNEFKSLIHGQQ